VGVGGGGHNEYLLFHLAFNNALPASECHSTYVALQRRHPDGGRWVEVARFLTHVDAEAALAHVVEGGHADASELRVHRVQLPQP
jgi:hypothetical protein